MQYVLEESEVKDRKAEESPTLEKEYEVVPSTLIFLITSTFIPVNNYK